MTFDTIYSDNKGFAVATQSNITVTTTTLVESTMGSPSSTAAVMSDQGMSANMTGPTASAPDANSSTAEAPAASSSDGSDGSDGSDSDTSDCQPATDGNDGDCQAKGRKRDSSDGGSSQGGQWKIQTVYSEFNTGAWIKDMGGECAMPAMG